MLPVMARTLSDNSTTRTLQHQHYQGTGLENRTVHVAQIKGDTEGPKSQQQDNRSQIGANIVYTEWNAPFFFFVAFLAELY